MADPRLLETILQQLRIEYALCDAERRIVEHSPGLANLATGMEGLDLRGRRLEEVFDEFKGVEEDLAQVAQQIAPQFQIAYTYREGPNGQPRYLTFTVVSASSGLLVIAADVTQEAQLVQRLMQERNEVILLRRS